MYREAVSSVNCHRSEKIIVAKRRADVFKAMKTVYKWKRFSKIKTEEYLKVNGDYNLVRSLKHWFTRTKVTIVSRDRI